MFFIIGWTITIAIILFVIVSVILFIKDGIASKKEGRQRKNTNKVMFIISMTIEALAVTVGVLLWILAVLVMRSM